MGALTGATSAGDSETAFWHPGGAAFRVLQPGELFLIKLHGRPLIVPPAAAAQRPAHEYLEWHNRNVFVA